MGWRDQRGMKNIFIAIPVLVGSLLMSGCATTVRTLLSSGSGSGSYDAGSFNAGSYDTSTQDMLNQQASFDQMQNQINSDNNVNTQNMVNTMMATALQNNQ